MSLFIVDTNFFIQSHRVTYPLDVAKGFWGKVKKLADEGKIISIDKVKDEIYQNDDELKKWVEINLSPDFFRPTENSEVLKEYSRVINWANSCGTLYLPKALNEFLEYTRADAWLVAYALFTGTTSFVVTQEKSEPNKRSKIKIPEACTAFNIPYRNTIEMFRELGETF
jgi:hypothetical protein